jgi:hypothetical protein
MAGRPPCRGRAIFNPVEAKLSAAGDVVDEPGQAGIGGDRNVGDEGDRRDGEHRHLAAKPCRIKDAVGAAKRGAGNRFCRGSIMTGARKRALYARKNGGTAASLAGPIGTVEEREFFERANVPPGGIWAGTL